MKSVCFFSRGFAYNRLVRMQNYEKIFPKDVKIFLLTTDKNEKDLKKWKLSRTKIFVEDKNLFLLPIKIRRFCKRKRIDVVSNIGYFTGGVLLLPSTLFSQRKLIVNHMADFMPFTKSFFGKLKNFFQGTLFYLLVLLSDRSIFVDFAESEKYKKIFGGKIVYLPAPVDTNLFVPKNKENLRKKQKIPKKRKVVIYVGRLEEEKGSDIINKLAEVNRNYTFLVIGKNLDKDFNVKRKNIIYFREKNSRELADLYNLADILVYPHRVKSGGAGIVVEEALASGTPVITSIRRGINGEALFQVESKFEKVNKRLQDFFKHEDRNALRKSAREFALKEYSLASLVKRYRKAYLD